MSRLRIWRNYYLGTGMLTVVGTSFATLSTANSVSIILHSLDSHTLIFQKIFNVMYSNGTCPSTKGQDGTITRLACPDAYGYVLGATALIFITRRFLTIQQEPLSSVPSSKFSCP